MAIQTDNGRKDNRRVAPRIALAAFAALVALPIVLTLISPRKALVRETGGAFFVARPFVVVGDRLLCLRSGESFSARNAALDSPDGGFGPALVPLGDVALIEIIPETPSAPETAVGPVPLTHLGAYRINASGNPGYLFVGVRNGVLYGTVRFPEWGKGAVEPLKGLYIRGNVIGFMRSITTPAERERTGAPAYFTQVYIGEYRDGGRTIQGRYMVGGSPRMWDARKTR